MPVALEIGAFPLGVPGPWTHLLADSGDDVLVQCVTADAALFAEAVLRVDLSSGWAIVRGEGPDGSFAQRPPVAADAGERGTRVYLAHQVREALDRAR